MSFLSGIFGKQKKEEPQDTWETIKTIPLSYSAGQWDAKKYPVKLQVKGEEQKILLPDDFPVAFQEHSCYTNFIIPWSNSMDFSILEDGSIFCFAHELHIQSLNDVEDHYDIDAYNMDELESLVKKLRNNRQPETPVGSYAKAYADHLQEQIDSSEKLVSDLLRKITKGKPDDFPKRPPI